MMETTAAADALAEIVLKGDSEWWKSEARYELNDRLNASEERLRAKIGGRAVSRLVREFRAEAETKPDLWRALYRQSSPYFWIYRRAKRRTIPQPAPPTGP